MSESLVANRISRERDFHNKRFGATESRKEDAFYFAARDAGEYYWDLVRRASSGKSVLEYGCASGQSSINLADIAKNIVGIDISDVAIAQAKAIAADLSITNVEFLVENAEKMDLPDASFDVVFGSGILHHLDIERSLAEIRRVMRPGGTAIFFEPLGHNAAINWYRNRTPESRTSDEHPLLQSDFDIVQKHFSRMDLKYFGLSTLASIPFRSGATGRVVRGLGERIDRLLLTLPGLKWQAWIVVMRLEA